MLKRLREQQGLSQLQLAKQAKVAQAYISEMEAEQKKNPGIETLRKIVVAGDDDMYTAVSMWLDRVAHDLGEMECQRYPPAVEEA